jgi:hypothetical protein
MIAGFKKSHGNDKKNENTNSLSFDVVLVALCYPGTGNHQPVFGAVPNSGYEYSGKQ